MTQKNVLHRVGSACCLLFSVVIIFTSSCKKDALEIPNNSIKSSTLHPSLSDDAPSTGTILREEWDNIIGNDIIQIPVNSTPSSSSQITSLEGPQNHGSNYGDRMRGYIYPPTDGVYTFWIAGDDASELWLSIDDNPGNKTRIANIVSWSDFREWGKYPSQKSTQITLKANQKYYIEVLHKQGGGGDNVSVQWQLPGDAVETPIPGIRLSPYIKQTKEPTGTILREEWANVTGNDVENIPVENTPSSISRLNSLEGPLNHGSNYGDRMRGYIYPPTDGVYKFGIAGDDAVELWLSTDDSPANKVKIAGVLSWTNFREWNKFASQTSIDINMLANHKYYIEVLHKQGGGGDNVSVKWQLPGNITETPIPGSRLSLYENTTVKSAYIAADVINLTDAHNITISGKSITGGGVPAITLINCYDIHITNSKFYNGTDVGIHLLNCKNITIDYNYFTNVSSGVYAEQTTDGGIVVDNNQFLNMQGPFPRGQFVQFNNVSGANSSISHNKGENILGQSYAEDAINLYQSHGTAASPVLITGNWIRGGGPSASGGGILLGDNGGSYLKASNNLLVNPGEYGMAIVGGDHNSITNNIIYGKQQNFTNVGIYVNIINGYSISDCTVSDNKVNYYNASNYNNNAWLAPGLEKPKGWDKNDWGKKELNNEILPNSFITYQ